MSDDPRYRRDAWGRQRRQAQQTAYEALHQGCNTLQWTGSGLGFVPSTAVFFTALPATATGNPVAIAAAVFSGMGALGSVAVSPIALHDDAHIDCADRHCRPSRGGVDRRRGRGVQMDTTARASHRKAIPRRGSPHSRSGGRCRDRAPPRGIAVAGWSFGHRPCLVTPSSCTSSCDAATLTAHRTTVRQTAVDIRALRPCGSPDDRCAVGVCRAH